MRHPLRRKNLRPRLLPLYGLAGIVVWLARPTPVGLGVGALVVASGVALRLWAAGHLVKTDRLTMGGPYRYVRHPMYLGSLLIGIGLGLAAGALAAAVVLVLGLPIFALYYLPYKERIESARLQRRFGDAFLAYRAAVPAFVPSLGSARGSLARRRGAEGWSLARVRENDELGALAAALTGVAVLALRASVTL